MTTTVKLLDAAFYGTGPATFLAAPINSPVTIIVEGDLAGNVIVEGSNTGAFVTNPEHLAPVLHIAKHGTGTFEAVGVVALRAHLDTLQRSPITVTASWG
jgi:hypothetical protein